MGEEDAVAGGLVGGLIAGSIGYKTGYDAGYKKKEQEDMYVIGTLRIQLATANQNAENLRKDIERLKKENEDLRSGESIVQRVKAIVHPTKPGIRSGPS